MASSVNHRLIKKEEEDSDDECTFLSSTKNIAMKGDPKQAICIGDDDETTSGPSTRPQKASFKDNLTIVKDESDDEKETFKMKELEPPSKDTITAEDFCDTINVDPESSDEDADDEDDPDSAHEEDSDYHDSDDGSDDGSDDESDSDNSETQKKTQRPKIGVSKVSDIKKLIKKCENAKNALIVKEYMGEKLSLAEREKLEKLKKQIPKAHKELEKHARQSPPKTAREYWQRHLKRQEEKEDRKRKRDSDETNPNKLQKTGMQAGFENPGFSRAAALFTSSGAQDDDDDDDDDGEPANSIKATTHEAQMKQIMAGIPEGNDTRHTKTQKRDLVKAKKCFGYKKIKAIDGKWKLKGMETPMHSQQLVAATWMVRREAMGLHPAGGILGDEMGLGKTITALATIVGHPAEPEDREDDYGRATLVIADSPHSASRTWMDQIKKHTSVGFTKRCLIYSEELEKDSRWWSTKNVVITYLNKLRAQFPSKREYQTLKAKWAGDESGFQQALSKKLGPLFKVNWYRIILDEAHGIKNHSSSGALAVWRLNAKYRWALTGTPLANKLDEFFPYLKFIGCNFATTMRQYRAEYIKSDQAAENFEQLVALVMLRRQQTEKFLGHTMVPLPKSHRADIWIPCSGWEKILLEVVDGAYQEKLLDAQNENQETAAHEHQQQQDTRENEVESDDKSETNFEDDENNGSNALDAYRIQLLRCLRLLQVTSHPLTLEKFYREEDHDVYIDMTLERLKSEVTQSNLDADQKALEVSLEPAYSSGLQQLELVIKDNFGGSEEMEELLKLTANEKKVKDVTCAFCNKRTPPENPVQSSNCEHVYCHDCLSIAVKSKTKTGRTRVMQAPQCQITGCSPILGMGQAVKTLGCIDAAVKAIKGYKEPGRDSIGTRWTGSRGDMASFFRAVCGHEDIDYGPVKMPLSSKVKATLAVMLTWMKEAPDDKIILYVQWTRTAKALGCVLESMGIKFLYYNRMANQKQKTQALDEFANKTDIKILVSSMKCGGQSLNLQMANRVIILDEWWNKAAEEQAFKRVYRTGQLKETHLVRIIAKDSMDERIIMLQDAKEEVIRAALQDGEMQPNFSNYLQLQMLFSGKDKETLIAEMEMAARAKQAKQ
ncbi:related to protein RIS1 [Fusarium fujikuroi IMI 58289]|uniref:Related to protein RIS1 n=1 Tax=Gibberella fujikuroi (strain CBS 195.34 / IMI 58289 / NRRL A-6831) TaxID=1279085 RepID=S0E906_GIBF5|nr:related to protein RIS1 [Fusarium fujikuroi IMI 58289]CCT71110.1 related to protein RIS1 [Fusarium fujikuroi IMI 58289]